MYVNKLNENKYLEKKVEYIINVKTGNMIKTVILLVTLYVF